MATIKTREQLIAKFEEIEREYSVFYSAVYPDFVYTKKTFDARSEETLTDLAADLLAKEKMQIDRLRVERVEALAKIARKPDRLLVEKEEKIAAIESAEAQALSDLSAEVLARSMHKSAYYLAQSGKIRENAEKERAAAETAYSAALSEVSEEEETESARYDVLMAEATASYNAALAAKKEELLLAEAERAMQALEYNNSMEKEAVEYNMQAVNGVFDRANEDTVTRTSMMYEKMQACYDYLSNFTTLAALTTVRSDEVYSKYLGSYGSKALVTHYQNLYDAEQSAS